MPDINYLAVLAAAVSAFVLGGAWYSPALFGKLWQKEAFGDGPMGKGHPAMVFGISFLHALIAALLYAALMPAPESAVGGLVQGTLVGAGFVATSFGINYQFANRTPLLWLVDGGYHTFQFALYGLIIGAWR